MTVIAYNIDNFASVFPANDGAGPTFHANGANNVDITIDFMIESLAVSVGDNLFAGFTVEEDFLVEIMTLLWSCSVDR